MNLTFVTGNGDKAKQLQAYLGLRVDHVKLDLDEVQSLDLAVVVEHKARLAYQKIQSPVLVDDMSLEMDALNGLPGPFVRFFLESMKVEGLCRLASALGKDAAKASCCMAYFDGQRLEIFRGELQGKISKVPLGEKGYGWDQIFIPKGYEITRSQMSDADYEKTFAQLRPLAELKKFLAQTT